MSMTQTLARRAMTSRLAAALAWPHGVDRYLELLDPMLAAHDVRARVVDVRRENPDSDGPAVTTLTLQPTSSWRGHLGGQYVQVGVDVPEYPGRRLTRCFSVSSAASGPGEQFTLTVRAHEEGQVSKFLAREAQPGQLVHLSQAEGEFTLPGSPATPSPDRVLMISGGSGITPVMSQLRTLLRDGYDGHAGRPVTFVHFARSPEDQIFREELDEIAEADNGVAVHRFYGDQMFTEELLEGIVPGFREVDAWACGPAGLIDLVQAAYADSDRLRVEFFKVPTASTGEAGGDLSFTDSEITTANTGESILEQAEGAGLSPEFGCRMGICFSCTTRKSGGTIRNVLTGEQSSLPDEDIRICVSAPVGDCAVEL